MAGVTVARANGHYTEPGPVAAPRILQVVLSLWPGGTEQLVVELCRRLAPRFQPIVCCLDEPGAWGLDLVRRGVEVIGLGRRPGFQPSLAYKIARLAADRGANILHCHHYSPFVYGRLAKLVNPRLRVVFTEHGRLSDAAPNPKRKLVNPWLARIPGPMFAVSSALRTHMIDEGFPADRVRVIHNGIDPGTPPGPFCRRRARVALGLDDRAFVVGTAARLDPVKDLPSLIDAFDDLRRRVQRAHLVIAGDGLERPRLERLIRERQMEHRVSLLGHREDVRELLPAFDVYANSSISEGISITILEAMAAAVPVVATSVGGTPEIITDEKDGVLVPARRADVLAQAFIGLAGAPARRETLGAAGRQTVEQRFRVDAMVDAYAQVYAALGE